MSMHYCTQGRVQPTTYVVRCKRCQRDIPSGSGEFPKENIVVRCTLCGELRRYRPSEVFLGFVDVALTHQQASRRNVR